MADITGIGKPTYVALSGSTLYVSEHGNLDGTGGGRVLKYTLDSNGLPGAATVIATRAASTDPTDPANDGHFISPDAIVLDASGNLFVADRYMNRITKLSPTGTFMGKFGVGTVGNALEMHGPNGMAIDASGNLYISEHGDVNGAGLGGQQVGKYAISGTGNITAANVTRLWHIGSAGTGNGQFAGNGATGPYGVTLSADGTTVMVSDGFNARVESFSTATGAYASQFSIGSAGMIALGSSLDGSGALWIAESSSNGDGATQQITKLNASTGASLGTTIGTLGSGALQFHLPFDVAVNSAATRAYVADWANSRVEVINLTPTTTAPSIAATQTATAGTVGAGYNYQVQASNATTFTLASGSLPNGLSLSASGVISGTPTTAGSSTVVIQVSNSGGGTASGQVSITIQAAATAGAPTLPAGPSVSSMALTSATTGVGAHGTMTVTFDSAVTGVDQTDFAIAGPGTITGVTPVSATQYGVNFNYTDGTPAHLQVAIKTSGTGITDGSSNAFYGKGVTATTNYGIQAAGDLTPPSVSSFTAGTPGASSVNFTLVFNQAVTGVTSGSFVVGKSGTLAATVGTPTTADGGTTWTVPVSFTGTGGLDLLVVGGATTNIKSAAGTWYDGSGSSTSASVSIGGTSSGSAPVITSPLTASVNAGASFSYTITASNSPTTFTATGLPSGLTFTSPTISGSVATAGTYNIAIGASNASGSDSKILVLTVNPVSSGGSAPVITSPLTASVNAGASFSYTITASNSPTTFTATGLPSGLTFTSPTISGSVATAGTYNITIGASNASGSDSKTLVLTVNPVSSGGSAPVITSPLTASVNAGASFSYTITASNSPTTFTATGLPSGLTFTSPTISGSVATAGTYNITIGASNASGSDSKTLVLTVNPVSSGGSAPVITSPLTASVNAGASFSYTITASNSPTTFTATGLPSGLTFAPPTISGAVQTAGTYHITIGASNASGSDSKTLVLTVNAVNVAGAPVVSNATVTGTVGTSINAVQVQATNSPTSFSAPNLPIYGLTISNTGVITGVPTIAVSGATVSVTASNSLGTSQPATITLNIAGSTTNTGGGGGGGGGGGFTGGGGGGGFSGGGSTRASQTIVFLPSTNVSVGDTITLSASSSAGLPVTFTLVSGNATLNNNVLSVTGTGAIVVRAYNNGDASTLGASTDATITAKTKQTVTFVSPTSGIIIGTPVQLSATSSAGLPITFSVVSGSGTISGNTLTPTGPGALVVRATSAGSSTVASASTDVNFGNPQKAAQAITFATMPDVTVTSGPIKLAATSSSGLALKYSVSGPATLNGDTLTLTGAAGTVTITAVQSGDDSFNPAAAVTRTFQVRALNEQVYFGTMGTDAFAVAIAQDNSRGTFLMRVASTGEAIVITFKINADGTFTATSTSSTGQSHTLIGSVANTTFAAKLDNTNVGATLQSPSGASSSFAGLYMATIPGSASGTTYLVVSPSGQTFALNVTDSGTASGTGTLSSTGSVDISAGSGTSISATLDGQSGAMKGTVTAAGVTNTLAGLNDGVTHTDRLVNVSSRLRLTGGDSTRAVIAGFVVTGTESKQILVRAIGPGLAAFGVSDALSTPALTIYDSTGKAVATNNGWNNDATIVTANKQVGAFDLTAGSHDSALLLTLAPGAYTAQVTSANNGIVLIEVYDATTSTSLPTKQLINISTRGFVGTGDDSLVAGFAVTGNAPKRVLIRGIGPALTAFGVSGALADPQLKLYASGSSTAMAQNDNWGTPQPIGTQTMATAAEVTAADTAAGAFPLTAGSKDAVIVITLNPGSYSAVMSGVGGATGAGLIEVYEIPNP